MSSTPRAWIHREGRASVASSSPPGIGKGSEPAQRCAGDSADCYCEPEAGPELGLKGPFPDLWKR
jgi:hypothetical protein